MNKFARTMALLLSLLFAPLVSADTVTLKDGTTLEGEIVREGDGFIYIEIAVGDIRTERLILTDNIKSIERTDNAPKADMKPGERRGDKTSPKYGKGVERIAFISLEEMVGPFMNADALSESIDMLKELPEEEQPTIVVLRINSGGGALSEIQPLMNVITDEIRPHFRTVAWIESAISAAAMTAWVVPEIYFQTKGNFGACTGFRQTSGGNKQMDGRELQQVLFMMEEASSKGGYDPAVMRAMQISGPDYPTILSADIDEHGNVRWYLQNDPKEEPIGEYLVSPSHEILTFDSREAEFFGFSKGTADTKRQLAELMGVEEWVEVGQEAEEHMVNFRDRTRDAQVRLNELEAQMQNAMANAASGRSDCARWVGKARRHLGQIRSTVRGTSLKEYTQYQDEWFQIMEEQIREIQEQCNERTR